jgi:hypothetical protein
MTSPRSKKHPSANPKNPNRFWSIFYEILKALAVFVGLVGLPFDIYTHWKQEGEKASAKFSYFFQDAFPKSKATDYFFTLNNQGTKDSLQIHAMIITYDQLINIKECGFSDPTGCKMSEAFDGKTVTISADSFGVPAEEYFFFKIRVPANARLIIAKIIPANASPVNATTALNPDWGLNPDTVGGFARTK